MFVYVGSGYITAEQDNLIHPDIEHICTEKLVEQNLVIG